MTSAEPKPRRSASAVDDALSGVPGGAEPPRQCFPQSVLIATGLACPGYVSVRPDQQRVCGGFGAGRDNRVDPVAPALGGVGEAVVVGEYE